jgi:tetratricopeptide (TPR) repeat protein
MYREMKWIGILLVAFIFTGCLEQKNAEIKLLESQLATNENSAQIHAKLAQQYFKVAIGNKNIFSLNKSYEEANKALDIQPSSLQYKALVFNIGYTKVLLTSDQDIGTKLKKLSPELMAANLNVAPPSFIDAMFVNDDENTKLYNLLKAALKENPKFPTTYTILSTLYKQDKRYNLAIDILKRGLKLGVDEVTFHYLLTNVYMEKSYYLEDKTKCASNNDKLTKLIIKEAKEVLKLKPEVIEMYRLLALSYERLGLRRLAIHSQKMIYDKLESQDSYDEYLDFLLTNGEKSQFFKKIQTQSTSDYNMAMAYFANQDWAKSAIYFKKYLNSAEYVTVYRHILLAVTEGKSEGRAKMIETLQHLPKEIKVSAWSQKILDYLMQKSSEETLLNGVNTPCKKTEAYFYIALNSLIDNDKSKAKSFFQKVVDEKVYAYVEYMASSYYLKDGLK